MQHACTLCVHDGRTNASVWDLGLQVSCFQREQMKSPKGPIHILGPMCSHQVDFGVCVRARMLRPRVRACVYMCVRACVRWGRPDMWHVGGLYVALCRSLNVQPIDLRTTPHKLLTKPFQIFEFVMNDRKSLEPVERRQFTVPVETTGILHGVPYILHKTSPPALHR